MLFKRAANRLNIWLAGQPNDEYTAIESLELPQSQNFRVISRYAGRKWQCGSPTVRHCQCVSTCNPLFSALMLGPVRW